MENILNDLLSHQISKAEALSLLKDITDGLRNKGAIEFEIDEISFTVQENHAYVSLKKPYGYNQIKNIISKGDKIDLNLIP